MVGSSIGDPHAWHLLRRRGQQGGAVAAERCLHIHACGHPHAHFRVPAFGTAPPRRRLASHRTQGTLPGQTALSALGGVSAPSRVWAMRIERLSSRMLGSRIRLSCASGPRVRATALAKIKRSVRTCVTLRSAGSSEWQFTTSAHLPRAETAFPRVRGASPATLGQT